ncbi:MAG: DUF1573 domain-containing protein [Bacteroidia bacterium]
MKRLSLRLSLLGLCAMMALSSCEDKGKTGSTSGNNTTSTPAPDDFKVEPGQGTPIQFSHLKMEFKPVVSGDTVKAVYPFKNMTNTPVAISQAITSCACMMTDFTKGNIQPGQTGEVRVNFATAGQFGDHYKIISVMLQGSNEPITLQLNGHIDQAK